MSSSHSSSSSSSSSPSSATQSLTIDVRATTQGFAQDIAAMRQSVDGTLTAGFTQAGSSLQTSLNGAIANGISGFTNLRGAALSAISDIAAQLTSSLFSGASMTGAVGSSGVLGGLAGLVGSLSGLPGRATGGPVSPGQAYVVGERGPEMFVPTSAGSIAPSQNQPARDVRVSINLNGSAGSDAPQAMQRSSRQMASALRRALTQN